MKTTINTKPIILLIILFFFAIVSCTRNDYQGEKIISPSGKYYLIAMVNRTDTSKQDYQNITILIYNSDDTLKSKLAINASDISKWAVGWEAKKDTILLNSSDIGTYAWMIEGEKTKLINMTDELMKQAKKMKEEKYHSR